ncbi:Esterase OVCA2 [Hondaea fermentalgiana]|uniref:Esterase OVCA2 n=1 Tax=Hondaea fermentalgiana TaxID=2315210 RepID=A0A2R5G8S6_9STRA|nr:Esterase OVCA2 [Hondaea fermentalgiana]|eukprot:GBG27466.1 Esterase OVCA2 [Hondaea fermentalgiana]
MPREMRLLALHGRYQSAVRFAEKLAGSRADKGGQVFEDGSTVLRTRIRVEREPRKSEAGGEIMVDRGLVEVDFACGSKLELVALESPHEVEAQVNLASNKSLRRKPAKRRGTPCSTRAWWFKKDDDPHFGADQSIDLVLRTLREQGPFDGLLGYSQGASLVGLLCSRDFADGANVDIGIMCSGYAYDGASLEARENMRSLHLYSPLDRMIRADKSENLARLMNGIAVEHEKGHSLPVPWVYEQIYERFFPHEGERTSAGGF